MCNGMEKVSNNYRNIGVENLIATGLRRKGRIFLKLKFI